MLVQSKTAVAALGVGIALLALLTGARALSQYADPTCEYRTLIRDSDVYASVGDSVKIVASIKRGEVVRVRPGSEERDALNFGFGTGFIDKHALGAPLDGPPAQLHPMTPCPRRNLITPRPVTLYTAPDDDSPMMGVMAGNLRYPIAGLSHDRFNHLWYEITLGDRPAFIRAQDSEQDHGIPVLTYHSLLTDVENTHFLHTSTTTSDDAFNRQMAYLKEAGYTTLSLYQLEDYLHNRINLPGRAVVLTFDDGLKSVCRYAYPILKQYGFHATAFIITSRIKAHPQPWDPNSLQFMSSGELQQIADVFDFQSHTHFLHRLGPARRPVLFSRTLHNIELDFEHTRRALSPFNAQVWYLSYPFGGYSPTAVQAAKAAGFHMALTTQQGKVLPGDNPFTLKRLFLLRTDSIETMAARLAN
ncbi:polysaccharide deacetylase family protein [Lonsdalea quercina]|uniref:polysaccharide deacetylase family protein n=1 Tax=Lonsdalea quercina TaxID=71657 RepID=UPI00047AE4A3|nr:polysaccharide deacetylase family protein [Lonsdalea quercina]